jgi:hypothetical protein
MKPFQFRYNCRRQVARLLAKIELHRLEVFDSPEGEMIRKSRRSSHLAIAVGNFYLRMQGAGVEVLTADKWLQWELAVWTAIKNNITCPAEDVSHRAFPSIRFNSLVMPRLSGEPLGHILADEAVLMERKLQCLGWALQTLADLHAQSADWGGDLVQLISHGDATVENVIIDQSNQRGHWIDFDTRHRANLDAIDRHADDVRALIFSAATHLSQSYYPHLSAQLHNSYRHRDVIDSFRSGLIADWHRPNSFQLAQAPLSFSDAQALCQALISDLAA